MKNPDKAHVQYATLGVVVDWLKRESHLDGGYGESGKGMNWAMEAQDRIAHFIELERMKIVAKSKTFGKPGVNQP